MKKFSQLMFSMLAVGALMFAFAFTPVQDAVEAPGTISWKAESSRYKAEGSFTSWKFTEVSIPEGNFEKVKIGIEVDINSVSEKADGLVEHLKAPDFFDVIKFPAAMVMIDGATKNEDGSYSTDATMEIRGIKAAVPMTFTVEGDGPYMVNGTATVNRVEYGVGEAGGITEGVVVTFSAELAGE